MRRDKDIWAVAGLLFGRFGIHAVQEAEDRATAASRAGDRATEAIWRDVRLVLLEDPDLRAPERPSHDAHHSGG